MPPKQYKDRFLTLYFPSSEDMKRWQEKADAATLPLSHWIIATVENHLAEDSAPRLDLLRETDQSREELAKLRRELKDKAAAIEKMETELYQLRHQSFLQPSGQDHYSEDLITLLKSGRALRGAELLTEMGVDPMNTQALTIITRQLQNLQDLKLVEEQKRGWKWIG
jgi:hypothetical protein